MPERPQFPKPLLVVLAILFAIASVLYTSLWMMAANLTIPVELGFDNKYIPETHAQLVQSVVAGSPAERAGMRKGDRIIGINGSSLEEETLVQVWSEHKPGDAVDLSIERPGVSGPLTLHGTFRASTPTSAETGVAQHLGREINNLFPVIFVIVGLSVLFLRLEDPNAWLMALMFGSFVAIPGFANSYLGVPSALRPFTVAYRTIFDNLVGALFYFFFATFPTRSVIDRRLPWLKWVGLMVGAGLAVAALRSGTGPNARIGLPSVGYWHLLILAFLYGLIVLGFISLGLNAVGTTSSESRKKIRVILWGTLVGVVPATLVLGANDFLGYNISLLVGTIIVVLLWLFPLSFAYAVVKHRVLDIPILLRRSARYLLVQRGFVILLVLLSIGITTVFALVFSHYMQSHTVTAVPGGIALGTVFGSVLLWTGSRVHETVGRRIDRAFFRSAYDAQVILEDLVEKTRTATDRKELADLLDRHLKEALQPSSVAVYFETLDDQLAVVAGDVPQESRTLSVDDAALRRLAEYGRPRDLSSEDSNEAPLPVALLPLQPDCLVPILSRNDRTAGLIVLGSRLSEEPYSREDKNLLASVANQAGVALESFRLGEKVAERIEAERRVAQEMEFARQVQTRLFPQKLPVMATLEYAGGCSPARTVGGDYYDFLELRPGRLGMVLADIAGKGVPGALLMANLQANLRSQYAMAIDELPRLLASVSRLFYQSTDNASYATLFFADYDDQSHVLRYANCGHLPAIVLRGNGLQRKEWVGSSEGSQTHEQATSQVVWLPSTCPVVGLFEDWKSEIADVRLMTGDLFVLYTDGITEATNADGEEFGERRLVETLQGYSHLPVAEIFDRVVSVVRQFDGGAKEDDITLVIARCVT
jgi:phosphoserine phosphatase RsbU/P